MPIVATDAGGEYEQVSQGLHQAVCVDVIDMGMMDSTFGKPKHKIRIAWETDEMHSEEGMPLTVSKIYTLSLNEKANLTKDLESWFGKRLTDEARKKGVDIEKCIGLPCQINVVQGEKYATVSAIMPAAKGQGLKPSGHYVRVQDREDEPQRQAPKPTHKPFGGAKTAQEAFNEIVAANDDEIPF